MSTLTKAAEDAQRLAMMFSGLSSFGDELARIGSLQQAGDEAKARLDALAAEHESREDEHLQVIADRQSVAQRELDRLALSTAGIRKQLDDAAAEALALVARGQAEAERLAAKSQADISKAIDASAARIAAAEAERQSIIKATDELRIQRAAEAEDLRAIKQAAADEASKLATATAELERLKSLFGQGVAR